MVTRKMSKSVAKNSSNNGLSQIEQAMQLMQQHQICELEWEKNGERIHLRTQAGVPSVNGFAAQAFVAPTAPSAGSANAVPAPTSTNQKTVTSPFVGTFYRAPSPTADPYVREGQVVKRGDVLCIIEAMKLMNEIEAEFGGKIVSIPAENGQPVEFGEPLFIIET